MVFKFDRLPENVRSEAKTYFTEFEDLVPGWCKVIDFVYMGDSRDDAVSGEAITTALTTERAMDLVAHPEYRRALVRIYPVWMLESPEMKRHGVVHELVHVLLQPLAGFTKKLFRISFDDGTPSAVVADDEIRERVESVVEDLTHVILAARRAGDESS